MTSSDSPLATNYDPTAIERKCYEAWLNTNLFSSRPAGPAPGYCIMLPPPNVTGTLHMGHAFQHTLMDALARYQRMRGRDVLWQPGTDHAGIATQLVVSRELVRTKVDPATLSRAEFLDRIWTWKKNSGSSITKQMQRLGASCDWTREKFTMDPDLSAAVTDAFVRLHQDGLIYRGKRMVNWDPKLLTAVSDLEVVSEEEPGTMYHVRYPFVDEPSQGMVIATTRPETILVDGALAVAPGDIRFAAHVGRKVHVPRTDRIIEIISDSHVDPEFGSGCVKITPAHDFNDYEVYLRHPDRNLPVITLLEPNGVLNSNAPDQYCGLDRFAARRQIVADLRADGLLLKEEPHRYKLPRGDRSGAVVEPMLTEQWFVRTKPLAERALAAVREGRLRLVPNNWRATYEAWLHDIRDWCISRQLVWGHRIPAWYDDNGNVFVAHDQDQARAKCGDSRALKRDPDVLDTWFSSSLWPLSTLGWPQSKNDHFRHYFPTSVLVTGFDIIFFWVARMVMMAEYFVGQTPFAEVCVTGLVRDAHGRKMSKSEGNVLDPIDLIDGIELSKLVAKRTQGLLKEKQADRITKATHKEFPTGIAAHGADALRLTFASLASHGRDIRFDLGRIGGHRHFCIKLWNATRYVLSACSDSDGKAGTPGYGERWIISRLQRTAQAISANLADFRFDLVVHELHQLFWHDFCAWFIELSKVPSTVASAKAATQHTLIHVLGAILRLCHPVIPFITEKLWAHIGPLTGFENGSIMRAPYPVGKEKLINEAAEERFGILRHLVRDCRSLRNTLGIAPGISLDAEIELGPAPDIVPGLTMLARLGKLSIHEHLPPGSGPTLSACGTCLRLLIGPGIDDWALRLSKKIAILRNDRARIEAKLNNAAFVSRAPADVVAKQREMAAHKTSQIEATEKILRTTPT